MKHLLNISPSELKAHLEEMGQKPFRAKQILEWVWEKNVLDFEEMSNLTKWLRRDLAEEFDILTSTIEAKTHSDDGCDKLLLKWADGETTETVAIPANERLTACVSTQVGCAMQCVFCASGINGVVRNLTAGEIIEQVFQLSRITGKRVTNVVFMGMGEPLANYDATVSAVRKLINPRLGGISARKITVSTVGIPSAIRKLANEDLPITLAISLHAPNDELRQQIIPSAERYPIDDIISAANDFYRSRNREITLEYTLIDSLNDSPMCAKQLARIASNLRCNVNLIRFNPVESLEFQRPEEHNVQAFAAILDRNRINVNIRQSRGLSSNAACGQLRRNTQGS